MCKYYLHIFKNNAILVSSKGGILSHFCRGEIGKKKSPIAITELFLSLSYKTGCRREIYQTSSKVIFEVYKLGADCCTENVLDFSLHHAYTSFVSSG